MSVVIESAIINDIKSSSGVSERSPVRAATTISGTLATDFANGSIIDGVLLATNDRILIKDQASAAENGTYIVQASGAPIRDEDMNVGENITAVTLWVTEGAINGITAWAGSGTIGTNADFSRYDALSSATIPDGILVGTGGVMTGKKSEFAAASDPTALDDSSSGYSVGSRWIHAGNEFLCVDNTVGAAKWVLTTNKYSIASSIVLASTTSTTYIVIPSMTILPVAGTYFVSFSAFGKINKGKHSMFYAIFIGGTKVDYSERRHYFAPRGIVRPLMPLHTQAIVSVDGTQAIDVRYRQQNTATINVENRSLIIYRI